MNGRRAGGRLGGTLATRAASALLAFCVLIQISGCAGIFSPSPRGVAVDPGKAISGDTAPDALPDSGPLAGVDFASAFDEPPEQRVIEDAPAQPSPHQPLKVQKRPVRVLLLRNVRDTEASSDTAIAARAHGGARASFNGRVRLEAGAAGTVTATAGAEKKELRLPCTLQAGAGLIKIGGFVYRGEIVITSESKNAITLINILDVEDYLRGVVPREIGYLPLADIEAVKAQAVAARTYSYKRMAANVNRPFDMQSTVADQVYGVKEAEIPVSDEAVRLTKDRIMVHGNEIVSAYYHSTCGGKTANIEDVWGGAAIPYLRSQDDLNSDGNPFCAVGPAFAWTENWTEQQLSNIIRRYSSDGNLTPPFGKGGIKKIDIRERHECGRVKTLAITSTTNHEHIARGDKLRFTVRRNTASGPQILRSSNLKTASIANNKITITGQGFGHGIGMCQVGAIARARAGQNYEQILQSYYTGVLLRTVEVSEP